MSYAITLTDSVTSETYTNLSPPLEEQIIEGATDVTTIDMNLYTDFFGLKNLWSHTWPYMSEDEFTGLRDFYLRQFTTYEYPLLTITELGVTDVPVRMSITPQRIIDNCGTVEDVSVTFRESVQQSSGWESS